MNKIAILIIALLLHFNIKTYAQLNNIKSKIESIINSKNATIGVAINSNNGQDIININADKHFPMQSVFKLHIAIVMLSEIDSGKFHFDQKIKITKDELTPKTWSPIREKYPEGVTLTISELIEYMLGKSDNIACDILLDLIGGPQVVEDYFIKRNFNNLSIKVNENMMHNNKDLQFLNWATPLETNKILKSYYYNSKKELSKKSYNLLWNTMKSTKTGQNQLKGLLPKESVVAHKTGFSGINNEGTIQAINDVGIIFLPNREPIFISVFITNSRESLISNEKVISSIAKIIWDYLYSSFKL